MTPIISIAGVKNSGKTTLIEKLIPTLKSRGLRVAALKHDAHGFEMDHRGKDTFRFAEAGADAVGISCPNKVAHIELMERETSPEEFLQRLSRPTDLLLAEGFKSCPYPKIEVLGEGGDSEKMIFGQSPLLLATVGRESPKVMEQLGKPSLQRPHFTDAQKLADFLIKLYFEKPRMNVSAFIIAGGNSERLGRNKACAILAGKPLIQWVFRSIQPFFERAFVVTRTSSIFRFVQEQGAEILPDVLPEIHSLGGLYSALSHSDTEYAFIFACDTPFLQPLLLRGLRAASGGYDATVCRRNGQIEPLCGIYRKTCIGPIKEMLKTGNLRMQDLFTRIRARFLSEKEVAELDPAGFSFFDVDTQQDLEKAQELLL